LTVFPNFGDYQTFLGFSLALKAFQAFINLSKRSRFDNISAAFCTNFLERNFLAADNFSDKNLFASFGD
jgi:hypothetical protein